MYTRITQRSIQSTSLAGLQLNLGKLGDLQQQLSSGKLITKPSDSPSDSVSILELQSEIRANQQYSRNADDGIGWLNTIDNALSGAMDNLHRVRDLTLQGMSTGAADAQAREAIATEVDQIRQGLIQTGNAQYLDRPVFGGTTAGSAAYAADGTFIGDTTPVTRTVGDNTKVRVDGAGPDVFGTGDTQLFTVLADLSKHLRQDPTQVGNDLGHLDTATSRVLGALTDAGARYSRVMQLRQSADDRVMDLKSALSGVQDIDLPKTITELQMQQVAYQAALGATAKVIQPSLLDFLR
ncbi:MAG TPA: flagellar hook-associated protein FlgL [Mycobacteriales bacterium]